MTPDIGLADRRALTKDEIEITPEMIEAGIVVFSSFDERYESPCECVSEILKQWPLLILCPLIRQIVGTLSAS